MELRYAYTALILERQLYSVDSLIYTCINRSGNLLYCLGYILLPLHISGKGTGLGLGIIGKELCNWIVIENLLY